ncbi:Lymphocyte antigen 6K [Tupaia chinensis]|uniref:Lymphocyte antigen 6K n=1 Tax=Tupaia chinensis TaxID=246437 RepID=L9KL14_TUPCH|nr:Lymphocyte antigen 6K [Tupaia chinensis]
MMVLLALLLLLGLPQVNMDTERTGRQEIFPRFYYVSKQCSQFCPLIERPPPEEKSFILLKPLPFLYVKCCESNLCNSEGLLVNETMFREHVGRASEQKHGSVKLAARALHCHVCCGHENCESLVECAPTDKYCVITRATNPGGILVMKSCAPTCPNSTVSSDGRALSVSCCQGSQCNRSNSPPFRLSVLAAHLGLPQPAAPGPSASTTGGPLIT